jgi:hypothetical protein
MASRSARCSRSLIASLPTWVTLRVTPAEKLKRAEGHEPGR